MLYNHVDSCTVLQIIIIKKLSRKTTDEVSIKHMVSGDRGLVLGEGYYLEVKDALCYIQTWCLGQWCQTLDHLVLGMIVEFLK